MEDQKQSTAAVETTAKKAGAKSSKAGSKKRGAAKKKTPISHGKAFIQATYNNTIVTMTDLNGNVLGWSSAGSSGFTGPKKSTPYAASLVVKNALEKIADYEMKEVNVFVTGVGQGREAAVRAFNANNVQVLTIQDVTPIPHNGCRAPRPRRV
ncbi:30S ribosomal protein S11 [Patescibacteria group bacterium]|jgi:small subunit ribosomal protein S11|nr:30S ribosomal protein S11 [Patescibacteria group bacterium]